MKKNVFINKKRFFLALFALASIFACFIARFVDWQIINYQYYAERAKNHNTYTIKTDTIRGEILDCNGVGLAVNCTAYRAIFDPIFVQKSKINDEIVNILNFLEKNEIPWINNFPIKFENGNFEFAENPKIKLNLLKKNAKVPINGTAKDCINSFVKKFKCSQFRDEEKLKICAIRYQMERASGPNSLVSPYIISDSIPSEKTPLIADYTNVFSGLKLENYYVRRYENSSIAPHIVGYTGPMSSEEYEKLPSKENYTIDDKIGKSGIESVCEKYLKGTCGEKVVQKGKTGTIIDSREKSPNIPGNTVFLTIDSELQKVVNDSLERSVKKAKELGVSDCKTAAAVVLNVKDFSILAASTYPSYDLNDFVENSDCYSNLLANPSKPLLNRAFNGTFAPGSIFKPLVALAALNAGVISENENINCSGSFNFYRGYRLKCMGHHGNINITTAIEKSCNVFFAELGKRLTGATAIKEMANRAGMGVKTGIELPETSGIIACKENREKTNQPWYESGSSQCAIGQHDNQITPLGLATYCATIANNGVRLNTHIIKKITDFSQKNTILEKGYEVVDNLQVSEENLKIVQNAMRKVVLSGTARSMKNEPIEFAAKTGTAEVNKASDHTTFIAYAPFEKPEIALAIVVANGKFGRVSMDVARDIFHHYFKI